MPRLCCFLPFSSLFCILFKCPICYAAFYLPFEHRFKTLLLLIYQHRIRSLIDFFSFVLHIINPFIWCCRRQTEVAVAESHWYAVFFSKFKIGVVKTYLVSFICFPFSYLCLPFFADHLLNSRRFNQYTAILSLQLPNHLTQLVLAIHNITKIA